MPRIEISETQFAFAFFNKFLQLPHREDLKFVFPTLRQEGNPDDANAGADLVVNNNLFFQFKMGSYLTTANASEVRNEQLDRDYVPYFRFFTKNDEPSHQFDCLLDKARDDNNLVRYIAPMFDFEGHDNQDNAFYEYFYCHPIDSLNYIASIDFNQFVDNDDIRIGHDNSHKICYNRNLVLRDGIGHVFSNPVNIKITKSLSEAGHNGFIEYSMQNSSNIQDVVLEIIQSFKLEVDVRTIENVQLDLIQKHSIFWIPVLRDNQITRSLKGPRIGYRSNLK